MLFAFAFVLICVHLYRNLRAEMEKTRKNEHQAENYSSSLKIYKLPLHVLT